MVLLAALVCMVMLGEAGCVNPPRGTCFIDINGDGRTDALAMDVNRDGQPDLDPNGQARIVAGSEGYATAAKVDEVAPMVLSGAGGILTATGVGGALGAILAGLAAVWRSSGFGRIFMNLIMSVQAARQRLKDTGNEAALGILDETLDKNQLEKTAAEIQKIKDQIGLGSVTEQSP